MENKKTIVDNVFGTLYYDSLWVKDMQINFMGKTFNIELLISGEEDGSFTEEQYLAYTTLMDKWMALNPLIAKKIWEYYNDERKMLGYDMDEDDQYPPVKTANDIVEYIELTGITIPYAGAFSGQRNVGLLFDCTWDEEFGVGIRLLNEEIYKTGYQAIAV